MSRRTDAWHRKAEIFVLRGGTDTLRGLNVAVVNYVRGCHEDWLAVVTLFNFRPAADFKRLSLHHKIVTFSNVGIIGDAGVRYQWLSFTGSVT